MILTKKVKVRINNKNIDHYKSKNINVIYGEIYEFDVIILPKYSKYKIKAKCESCGNITELTLQKYNKNFERSGSYNCKSCNNITLKKTFIEKYGVDNPSKLDHINEKRKKSCLEKYNSEYAINSDLVKNKIKEILLKKYNGHQTYNKEILKNIIKKSIITKIKRNLIVDPKELNDWDLYKRIVRRLTEQNRKKIFDEWDGLDYYDNEYIKENFKLKHIDPNYPTLDHKISVIYGFNNCILPSVISDIDNLCITKKFINSKKSYKNEHDFIKLKKE
jgi:hypothetical protein